MDLHPYDIVCHDTTRHDSYHARMHDLIHDGQLWACQSCLLKLMYAIKCLGCQLVSSYIKGQVFPFSS
jgi:hypothetical protein